MKKYLVAAIVVMMALTACGSGNTVETTTATAVAEETTVEESKEDMGTFVSRCTAVEAKDVLRNPEQYVDYPVVVTIRINNSDGNNYFAYGLTEATDLQLDPESIYSYAGAIYEITDSRVSGPKLLDNDIVTIYGNITGVNTITNTTNGTTSDRDAILINAKYIDFVDPSIDDGFVNVNLSEYYGDEPSEEETIAAVETQSAEDDIVEDAVRKYGVDRNDPMIRFYCAGENSDDFVIWSSFCTYLTEDELSELSKDELRLAKNEIYARHGYIFKSADLRDYFCNQSWYYAEVTADSFNESMLNDYEKYNIKLIDDAIKNKDM